MSAATGQTSSVAPAGSALFCGNSSALPAIDTLPLSGTMSCAGALPVRNLKYSTNASAEVHACTCVWFGMVTLEAPLMLRPGFPLSGEHSECRARRGFSSGHRR